MGVVGRNNLRNVRDRGLEMFVCEMCGSVFSEPDSATYCYEEYYGVGSMFPNKNYGHYDICPYCGSEEIDSYYEENDDEDIIHA